MMYRSGQARIRACSVAAAPAPRRDRASCPDGDKGMGMTGWGRRLLLVAVMAVLIGAAAAGAVPALDAHDTPEMRSVPVEASLAEGFELQQQGCTYTRAITDSA